MLSALRLSVESYIRGGTLRRYLGAWDPEKQNGPWKKCMKKTVESTSMEEHWLERSYGSVSFGRP